MGAASQPGRDTAAAGALPRPPFLYLGCLNLGLVLNHVWPLPLTLPETALVRGTAGGGLILFGGGAAAARLTRVCPLPLPFPETALVRGTPGGGFILFGVAIVAAGIRNFARAATPMPSNQPVRALVTTGIHGWRRKAIC